MPRTWWAPVVGAGLLLMACLERQPAQTGKLVVMLVDRSQSTKEDRDLQHQACERILANLRAGDRLLAAYITDQSAADFRHALDEELPPPFPSMKLWDIESQYRKRKAEWERGFAERQREVKQKMEAFLNWESSARWTRIFETLRAAGQLTSLDRRPNKQLILFSDMIEESEVANFARFRPDEAFTRKEIERQRRAGILPDLRGVKVYVAGAHADTLERWAAIEKFWREYFAASGAELVAYSRALPPLGE